MSHGSGCDGSDHNYGVLLEAAPPATLLTVPRSVTILDSRVRHQKVLSGSNSHSLFFSIHLDTSEVYQHILLYKDPCATFHIHYLQDTVTIIHKPKVSIEWNTIICQ